MLKQRVFTAIGLILLIGGGIILLPPVWLAVLFAGLVLIAAWEWAALSGLSSNIYKSLFILLAAGLMYLAADHGDVLSSKLNVLRVRDMLGAGCLWWAVALLWVKGFPASAMIWRSSAIRVLMGLLTLVPAWIALVYLRSHEFGVVLIFCLIALVAAADIGAYFSGKAWGRSKLAPEVSPGKSWAGFWGGMFASIVLAVSIWLVVGQSYLSLPAVIAIALFTCLASVLGDLLESMVKREQGVKDSGDILPGHGGMLDRLDSMTAAAPVFALSLILVGW